jgi:hypothetical protein
MLAQTGAGVRPTISTSIRANITNLAGTVNGLGPCSERRGRVGYRRWAVLRDGGYAWSRETATRTQVAGTINLAPRHVRSSASTQSGWPPAPSTACRGVGQGRIPTTISGIRACLPAANRRWEDNLTKDAIKLGVNWRLNWAPTR